MTVTFYSRFEQPWAMYSGSGCHSDLLHALLPSVSYTTVFFANTKMVETSKLFWMANHQNDTKPSEKLHIFRFGSTSCDQINSNWFKGSHSFFRLDTHICFSWTLEHFLTKQGRWILSAVLYCVAVKESLGIHWTGMVTGTNNSSYIWDVTIVKIVLYFFKYHLNIC